jgi:hypothetical protein
MPKLFLIFLRDNLQFSFAGVGSCDLNNKDEIIVKKENNRIYINIYSTFERPRLDVFNKICEI